MRGRINRIIKDNFTHEVTGKGGVLKVMITEKQQVHKTDWICMEQDNFPPVN